MLAAFASWFAVILPIGKPFSQKLDYMPPQHAGMSTANKKTHRHSRTEWATEIPDNEMLCVEPGKIRRDMSGICRQFVLIANKNDAPGDASAWCPKPARTRPVGVRALGASAIPKHWPALLLYNAKMSETQNFSGSTYCGALA
jgi:hypothetical protein